MKIFLKKKKKKKEKDNVPQPADFSLSYIP